MSSLSDSIELYLLQLLEQSSGAIEIQRNELADRFRCVPSQINYVLATRFSPERGFLIESRRGGGGYVRILRMKLDSPHRILKEMDDTLDQRAALGYVARFKESGFLTEREAAIIMAALDRQVLKLGLPQRDILRANLLKVMLLAVLRHR
ncbi:MAG TPA: CtsR family transcriptional regulator [Firmicutes bacterium]|jgi:transcriptional regulator CtsR|nr:CtsR family transcriptional regulator [Bacillota bacterium]